MASENAEEIRGQRVEIISGCAFDKLKKGVGAEDALLQLLRGRCLECGVVSPGAIVAHPTFPGGKVRLVVLWGRINHCGRNPSRVIETVVDGPRKVVNYLGDALFTVLGGGFTRVFAHLREEWGRRIEFYFGVAAVCRWRLATRPDGIVASGGQCAKSD